MVYGVGKPTFAVKMIPMCSSRLNFPGLRPAETPRVTEGGDTGLTNAEELVDKPSAKQSIDKCEIAALRI